MIETHLQAMEAAIAAIRAELPPPVERKPLPRVIPATDCLWPDAIMKEYQQTYFENARRGLDWWYGVVDSAVVVTKPGNDLYKRLDGFNPDIIPGYKSVDTVAHAFDWNGWLTFFVAIASLVNERKPKRMLIDIEETIKDYVLSGGEPILRVIEQFGSMLHGLDCEFWLYPPPYWPGRDAWCQNRLRGIVKALDGDNVRFVSQRYQSPKSWTDVEFVAADAWTVDNLTLNGTFPEKVFFYGTDAYWPDERFVECLQLIANERGPDTDVLVYPGHARFVEASKVLAAALKEAKA